MNPIKNLQNIWIFCQTQPHGFDFHSHQFLKKYVCKGISYHSSHRPIVGRCRTRVEYEESVLCMWGSMLMKGSTLALKSNVDITRSQKQGTGLPKKGINVLQKLRKKKTNKKLKTLVSRVLASLRPQYFPQSGYVRREVTRRLTLFLQYHICSVTYVNHHFVKHTYTQFIPFIDCYLFVILSKWLSKFRKQNWQIWKGFSLLPHLIFDPIFIVYSCTSLFNSRWI